MKKVIDNEFFERLANVLKRLPSKKYCVLINYEYPGRYKDTHIYSVMNRRVVDYHLLTDIELIAKRYEENKRNIQNSLQNT